uniref:Dyslexia-associated protein KIAA0319-like protein n=1 Tax=Phallusia mammillata TaxID=59560 RepID=A0A6F9DGE5_9ASCI|nr:dyslexia-associated protein KIAA0319-like protein [Phallusia mammillata]
MLRFSRSRENLRMYPYLFGNFCLLVCALVVKSQQVQQIGDCATYSQSENELQITGPIDSEHMTLMETDTAQECAQFCCDYGQDNYTCDVATFVAEDRNCLLIQCPPEGIDSGPCQPFLPKEGDEVMPLVQGRKSTLIYIVKRNTQESAFDLAKLDSFFNGGKEGFELAFDGMSTNSTNLSKDKSDIVINDDFSSSHQSKNDDNISHNVSLFLTKNNTSHVISASPSSILDTALSENNTQGETQLSKTPVTGNNLTDVSASTLVQSATPNSENPISTTTDKLETVKPVNQLAAQSILPDIFNNTSLAPKQATTPTASEALKSSQVITTTTAKITTTTKPIIQSPTPTTTIPTTTASTTSSTTTSTKSTTTATSKATTTTTPAIKVIHVTVEGETTITLPENTVILKAVADRTPEQANGYDYEWRPITPPKDFNGAVSGITDDTYTVSGLIAGQYTFNVIVSDTHGHGEASVNVTVLEPARVNTPPVAIISPKHQVLTLPTNAALLDGSKSTDDVGIVSYHWEPVKAPLQSILSTGKSLTSEKVLQLKGLQVGNYTIELTVTDTDGATDSAQATIFVDKKIDNPPIANAGPDQKIDFPQNTATLCGNDSTDDWGIVAYKWAVDSSSENQVFDMQGARSKCLELSNLEVGEYTFQLTVTDEAGQFDTAKVTVLVQPESNHPPKANAGDPQSIFEPPKSQTATVTLDGSKSTDDKKVTSYSWQQISAPGKTTLAKPNAAVTTVTGLYVPGDYVYELTVSDEEGETDTDKVTITVTKEQPPNAIAGPDVTITLPDDVAILNGNRSTDNYGIASYKWTRDHDSPAIGRIYNHSDKQAVLVVEGLEAGEYIFKLNVTNIRKKSSTDTVKVTVLEDPHVSHLVELHLSQAPKTFTESLKSNLVNQLKVLLSLVQEDHVNIQSTYVEHSSTDLVVLFYVQRQGGEFVNALEMVQTLNQKIKSDINFENFNAKRADTYVCENPCSGHGRCHLGSKECECETFWMENFFRVYAGDGTRNCDWSVLYVIIVSCILIFALSCLVYFLTCCCLRRKRKVKSGRIKRKKHLAAFDNGGYEKLSTKTSKNGTVHKNGLTRHTPQYRSSSLMRSMTSSSDDENQMVFEKRQLLNGPVRRTRSKANWSKRQKQKSSTLVEISDDSVDLHSGDSFDGRGLDGGDRVALRGVGGDSTLDNIL